MSEAERVSAEIEIMKAELGINLDKELAEKLGIDPSAIAAWRRRGSVPGKYKLAHRRASDERQIENTMSSGVVSPNRLREAYVFALLDTIAKVPVPSEFGHLPENWFIVWRGLRLADAYSYLQDAIPQSSNKDELRAIFEEVKADVSKPDFLEWLETL